MKRVLLWLAGVVALFMAVDIAVGLFFKSLTDRYPMRGDYKSVSYLLDGTDEDLIILGSSVGLNSINPVTLSDSIGITAYSGASNGQTMPFFLTMLKAIADSPTPPSTILLGILSGNLSDNGPGARYTLLAPYYGKGISDIDSNMDNATPLNKVLMKSNLYRLNTAWLRILLYYIVEPGIQGENGFIAKPVPSYFPEREIVTQDVCISDERATQITEFARLCRERGIKLIVFMPPRFADNTDTNIVDKLRTILKDENAELWDDTLLEPFHSDSTLFYDAHHINVNGSKIYTDTVINRLKTTP